MFWKMYSDKKGVIGAMSVVAFSNTSKRVFSVLY